MRTRLALLALLGLSLCGCRSGGEVALLERELRMQEDRIYELEAELDRYDSALASSANENRALNGEILGGDPGPGVEIIRRTPTGGGAAGSMTAPTVVFPDELGPTSAPARAPTRATQPSAAPPALPRRAPRNSAPVEPPKSFVPPVIELPDLPSTFDSGRLLRPRQSDVTEAAFYKPPSDLKITKLVLNKQLTGGMDRDGREGDEGVMVVFELRNAAGELVKGAGETAVVVVDPAKSGAAARVARWNFTTGETASYFRKTTLGKGYHFELPWPSDPPTSDALRLFVRFTTTDGQRYQADLPIEVDPPPARSRQWTGAARAPNAPPRMAAGGNAAPWQGNSSRGASGAARGPNRAEAEDQPGVAVGDTDPMYRPQYEAPSTPIERDEAPSVAPRSRSTAKRDAQDAERRAERDSGRADEAERVASSAASADDDAPAVKPASKSFRGDRSSPEEETREPIREAKRSNRPAWKPYR